MYIGNFKGTGQKLVLQLDLCVWVGVCVCMYVCMCMYEYVRVCII